jgi:malate dehydrogenase (oxaloacetate-decarboxylating)
MNHDSIVFALANPDPEVNIASASKYAAVVASGRSDAVNQINNVLVFPGVFRGLLDARTNVVTDDVLVAAAYALANIIGEHELNPAYIIPSVFHPDVAKVVAAAVQAAAGSVSRLRRHRPQAQERVRTAVRAVVRSRTRVARGLRCCLRAVPCRRSPVYRWASSRLTGRSGDHGS